MAPHGGGLIVFDENGLAVESGGEVAELGARELEEFRRGGFSAKALKNREGGEQLPRGRRAEIEVDAQRDGIAGGGGYEVGRKVQAEHAGMKERRELMPGKGEMSDLGQAALTRWSARLN